MLKAQKSKIESVSHCEDLFKKEIINSFRYLKSYELIQLHFWLKGRYNKQHGEVINDIFQFIAV